MDLIHSKGVSPANFLDASGGANGQQVQKYFEVIDANPHIKVVLVNIFGGLMGCDVFANGILNAANEIGIRTPLVIWLQGMNNKEEKKLVEDRCGHNNKHVVLTGDLEDAATKSVQVAKDNNDHNHIGDILFEFKDDYDPLVIADVTKESVVEGVVA